MINPRSPTIISVGANIARMREFRSSRIIEAILSTDCQRGREPNIELMHAEQLHLEDQGRVWGDSALAPRSITEIGRDDQLSLSADFHRHQAIVPAFDHAPDADGKIDR